jgi:hypothetical protein
MLNLETARRALRGFDLDYSRRLVDASAVAGFSRTADAVRSAVEPLALLQSQGLQQAQALQVMFQRALLPELGLVDHFRQVQAQLQEQSALLVGLRTQEALQRLHEALQLHIQPSPEAVRQLTNLTVQWRVTEDLYADLDAAFARDDSLDSAIEAMAEALSEERPATVSPAAARRIVVIYIYVLTLGLIVCLLLANPLLIGILLAASGSNAKDAAAMAGRVFDRLSQQDGEPKN